eukprot:355821-Chlamydomonas_euryale.AAC.7
MQYYSVAGLLRCCWKESGQKSSWRFKRHPFLFSLIAAAVTGTGGLVVSATIVQFDVATHDAVSGTSTFQGITDDA